MVNISHVFFLRDFVTLIVISPPKKSWQQKPTSPGSRHCAESSVKVRELGMATVAEYLWKSWREMNRCVFLGVAIGRQGNP